MIRGISLDRHQAKLSIAGVRDKPGIVARIFSDIGAAHIIVDMIVQNASIDGTTDISFTIHEDELENARTILDAGAGRAGRKTLKHGEWRGQAERRRHRNAITFGRRGPIV